MIFFNANGNEVSIKDFFQNFSTEYFHPGASDPWHIQRLSRNSQWIESQIEDLLNPFHDPCKGIKCKEDVLHVLAWKIGGVNHHESQCFKEWKLYDKWSDNGIMKGAHWGKTITNIDGFTEFVANGITGNRWSGMCARDILDDLNQHVKDKRNPVSNIGPVYLITVLYFITNGDCPIYDIQAAKAIGAINDAKKRPQINREDREKIRIEKLQDKSISDPRFMRVYDDYSESIKDICGVLYSGDRMRYKTDRTVDRALWTYGHLFNAAPLKM